LDQNQFGQLTEKRNKRKAGKMQARAQIDYFFLTPPPGITQPLMEASISGRVISNQSLVLASPTAMA